MREKKSIVLFISVFIMVPVFAQHDPVYSQYMFNMLGINPAYAGSLEALRVTGLYRSRWTGAEGAPVTQLLSADLSMQDNRMGVGVQLFNDVIGIVKNTGVHGSYAYRIKGRHGTLCMGLQAGMVQFRAGYSNLQIYDPADPAFGQDRQALRFNFGAGMYYSTDRMYAGLSVPHLVGQNRSSISAEDNAVFAQNSHWFLIAGYVFTPAANLALKPSVLLRSVKGAPLQVDVNASLWFHDTAALGVSLRSHRSVRGMLEVQIHRQLRAGYAYDRAFSTSAPTGSHEVMVRYEFGYAGEKRASMCF